MLQDRGVGLGRATAGDRQHTTARRQAILLPSLKAPHRDTEARRQGARADHPWVRRKLTAVLRRRITKDRRLRISRRLAISRRAGMRRTEGGGFDLTVSFSPPPPRLHSSHCQG